MEMIQSRCCCSFFSNVGFLPSFPFMPLRVPALSPRLWLPSKHSHRPLYRLLSTPFLSLKPLHSSRAHLDDSSFVLIQRKAVVVAPELKGTSVFLVGLNSSIKCSLGKLLADALRYYYFDSDILVEEAAGGKAALESFKENDELGFRDSETEVLKQLSSMGRLVVCAGNGAVQSATNLALLRHGISIWIDVPLDMVVKEVLEDGVQLPASESSSSGPYSKAMTQLTSLYKQMQGGYATADTTVSLQKVASKLGYEDFTQVTVDDMTLEILKEIEKLVRKKKMMEAATRPF